MSRVIAGYSELHTVSENVRAVENRGHLQFFEPIPAEVHRKVGEWFWDQDIYDFMGENIHLLPGLAMRHYVQAAELKEAGMDWLDIEPRQAGRRPDVAVRAASNETGGERSLRSPQIVIGERAGLRRNARALCLLTRWRLNRGANYRNSLVSPASETGRSRRDF